MGIYLSFLAIFFVTYFVQYIKKLGTEKRNENEYETIKNINVKFQYSFQSQKFCCWQKFGAKKAPYNLPGICKFYLIQTIKKTNCLFWR